MPRLVHRTPKLCHHKASGRAYVTLDGKDIYLGQWGSPAAKAEYNRTIAEWLANGRRQPAAHAGLTIVEIINAFWRHAQGYYCKPDGTPTSEADNFRDALRPLKRLYAETSASDFGPLALKAVRDEMIRLGWCRTNINRQIGRIKHVFKWAVENEMVPPSIYQALAAVGGLRAGRSKAKESTPVQPVAEDHVRAIYPFVSRQVRALLELQQHTGARPGEVLAMRGCDLDMTGDVWEYQPATHKTQHHGHHRVVFLGPKAKDVVRPFLKPELHGYLFSPADAEAERRATMHANRKTPMSCGNKPGTNVKRVPRKRPGERYTVESYCRAIHKACDRAFPPPESLTVGMSEQDAAAAMKRWRDEHRFHPHQLRHSAATNLRKQYGLEAAQVILGHRTLTVTQVYAEKNVAAAMRIMAEVG